VKRAIVDRFEEGFAVCEMEDESFIDIEVDRLPKGVKEGDTIVIFDDRIEIDVEATENRRKRLKELMEDMWE